MNSHQSRTIGLIFIFSVLLLLLIGLAWDGSSKFRDSGRPKHQISERKERPPRPRSSEPRRNPALNPAHEKFRANLSSSLMTEEALSEYLATTPLLMSEEVMSLIRECGIDEIIRYLSSLPNKEIHNHYNNQTLRNHLAHSLLSSSDDEFIKYIEIMPSLSGESGIHSRVMALDLAYPERRLQERIRAAGIDYDQFMNDSALFFTTLYDNVGSMARVLELIESTENGEIDLVGSLTRVDIRSLPPRSSDDGVLLFKYLEKIKAEHPLYYSLSEIEEILESWLTGG